MTLLNITCRLAPFIHKAYYCPELLEAVSAIAGIDLVPAFDYEIGHCNISFNEKKPTQAELEKMSEDGDSEAFAWHRDSFPFVCVTMLSDCRDMIGGETVIRTGDGSTMKTRGPTMVRYKYSPVLINSSLKVLGNGCGDAGPLHRTHGAEIVWRRGAHFHYYTFSAQVTIRER